MRKEHREESSYTDWPIHVVPLHDLREHEPVIECWCHPTLDEDTRFGHGKVFVHHSMDGREKYETGERVPS